MKSILCLLPLFLISSPLVAQNEPLTISAMLGPSMSIVPEELLKASLSGTTYGIGVDVGITSQLMIGGLVQRTSYSFMRSTPSGEDVEIGAFRTVTSIGPDLRMLLARWGAIGAYVAATAGVAFVNAGLRNAEEQTIQTVNVSGGAWLGMEYRISRAIGLGGEVGYEVGEAGTSVDHLATFRVRLAFRP